MEEIKEIVLKEYQKGNIVVCDYEGLKSMLLADFIDNPTDEILYDLNRDEATILSFINDKKWINDFAAAKVIRALKDKIEELEKERDSIY